MQRLQSIFHDQFWCHSNLRTSCSIWLGPSAAKFRCQRGESGSLFKRLRHARMNNLCSPLRDPLKSSFPLKLTAQLHYLWKASNSHSRAAKHWRYWADDSALLPACYLNSEVPSGLTCSISAGERISAAQPPPGSS